MDKEFQNTIRKLSSKAVLKRMEAIKALHTRMKEGCWLSRLALEYVFENDPNSAIRNRVFLAFKRSSLEPREGYWEETNAF
jgi:hypothetical protein